MEVAFLESEGEDNKIVTKLFTFKECEFFACYAHCIMGFVARLFVVVVFRRALHYKPPDSSITHGRWNTWYRGDYLNLWSLANGPHGLFETTSCSLTFPSKGQEFECENRQYCYVDELATFKKVNNLRVVFANFILFFVGRTNVLMGQWRAR